MVTPCQWAAAAVDKKGQTFKITNSHGVSTEAVMVNAQHMSSGGYTMYTFSFVGPKGGPTGDGIYTISGGGAGETQTFLVVQTMPDTEIAYVASIACKA